MATATEKAEYAKFKTEWYQEYLQNVAGSISLLDKAKAQVNGKIAAMTAMVEKMTANSGDFSAEEIAEVQGYLANLNGLKKVIDPLEV